MVVLSENFWNFRGDDGRSRAHIPPMPYWIAIIRIAQLAMALLLLILTAVAASKIGANISSLALTWFTFAWTLLHLGWLGVSILFFPIAYNYWAQLAVEILTVIFWLASWADLAAESSSLVVVSSYGLSYNNLLKVFKEGTDLMKASAGLGALQWILFVVTLVFFVISLVNFLKANKATGGISEAGAAEAKPLGPGTVEMAPVHVVPQQPQPQYAQPAEYAQQPVQYAQQPVQYAQPVQYTQPPVQYQPQGVYVVPQQPTPEPQQQQAPYPPQQ